MLSSNAASIVIRSPAQGTVVTGNTMYLAADASAPGDRVLCMEFHASFFGESHERSDTAFELRATFAHVGTDSTPPYEWNRGIRDIPDQFRNRARITFVARSAKGEWDTAYTSDFVIDRNPQLSTRELRCSRALDSRSAL